MKGSLPVRHCRDVLDAQRLQDLVRDALHDGVVLGEQDAKAGPVLDGGLSQGVGHSRRLLRGFFQNRVGAKCHGKSRALAQLRLHVYHSAQKLCQVFHDGKAEARPPPFPLGALLRKARLFSLEKGPENFPQRVGGKAHSRIADGELEVHPLEARPLERHVLVPDQVALAVPRTGAGTRGDANRNMPPLCVLHRIAHEVVQDLLQPVGVSDEQPGHTWVHFDLQLQPLL